MSPRVILPLAFFLLVPSGCGRSLKHETDSLEYEIYALQGSSDRELLAKGTVKCDATKVQVVERSAFGTRFWEKSVPLWQDLSVGASVYRERQLDGFGLWIQREGGGLSWNWFTLESGLTYRKLQGTGRVKVTLAPDKDYEELIAVEFLDDVTLSGNFGWLSLLPTHHVIMKKGSFLRLAP